MFLLLLLLLLIIIIIIIIIRLLLLLLLLLLLRPKILYFSIYNTIAYKDMMSINTYKFKITN